MVVVRNTRASTSTLVCKKLEKRIVILRLVFKKSFKTLAIITAENEADNRVDGAVCGGHEGGKGIV